MRKLKVETIGMVEIVVSNISIVFAEVISSRSRGSRVEENVKGECTMCVHACFKQPVAF